MKIEATTHPKESKRNTKDLDDNTLENNSYTNHLSNAQ
jgi:hypothetical protein